MSLHRRSLFTINTILTTLYTENLKSLKWCENFVYLVNTHYNRWFELIQALWRRLDWKHISFSALYSKTKSKTLDLNVKNFNPNHFHCTPRCAARFVRHNVNSTKAAIPNKWHYLIRLQWKKQICRLNQYTTRRHQKQKSLLKVTGSGISLMTVIIIVIESDKFEAKLTSTLLKISLAIFLYFTAKIDDINSRATAFQWITTLGLFLSLDKNAWARQITRLFLCINSTLCSILPIVRLNVSLDRNSYLLPVKTTKYRHIYNNKNLI